MARKRISRRTFVGDAGAAVAFTIVPRHMLGRGFRAPSDTLNIACIGVGGRGREDIKGVATENIYALCDVDDETAAETYAKYPRAKRYEDFRRSEEHTSELQSRLHLVCRLLLEKKKKKIRRGDIDRIMRRDH